MWQYVLVNIPCSQKKKKIMDFPKLKISDWKISKFKLFYKFTQLRGLHTRKNYIFNFLVKDVHISNRCYHSDALN